MKVARLAVLGVAVVAAGGAFFLANNIGSQEPVGSAVSQESQESIELEEVLVAAVDISLGGTIKEDQVKWQK